MPVLNNTRHDPDPELNMTMIFKIGMVLFCHESLHDE